MSARTILITGANGGLGLAIAQAFLDEQEKNFVWLGVHTRREAAQKLVGQFAARCQCVDLDVVEPGAWQSAVARIVQQQTRLDVLVNNAGRHADSLLGTMRVEDWHTVVRTNLDGAFYGCQAVLPTMIAQRGGRIINIASLSALMPPAGQTNYAAAKAGLVALTQSLAKEVARLNITVNALCPGFIETELLGSLDTTQRQAMLAKVPMRRLGQPAEVAAAVRFLACAEAGYITGSVLKIDGGII